MIKPDTEIPRKLVKVRYLIPYDYEYTKHANGTETFTGMGMTMLELPQIKTWEAVNAIALQIGVTLHGRGYYNANVRINNLIALGLLEVKNPAVILDPTPPDRDLAKEVDALLNHLTQRGVTVVRVREGNGPEDLAASLTITVNKLIKAQV